MAPLGDVSWILSLAAPVLEQWTHEWSSHGGRDGDYALVQQHGLLLTKADLATASDDYLTYPTESPVCLYPSRSNKLIT